MEFSEKGVSPRKNVNPTKTFDEQIFLWYCVEKLLLGKSNLCAKKYYYINFRRNLRSKLLVYDIQNFEKNVKQ